MKEDKSSKSVEFQLTASLITMDGNPYSTIVHAFLTLRNHKIDKEKKEQIKQHIKTRKSLACPHRPPVTTVHIYFADSK